jgi:hypothetical protein
MNSYQRQFTVAAARWVRTAGLRRWRHAGGGGARLLCVGLPISINLIGQEKEWKPSKKEELSALHAKLWTLRSTVDVLKGEVLLAKAPGKPGVVEEQREKRLQDWRRAEQVCRHWHDARPAGAGRIEASEPQIER